MYNIKRKLTVAFVVIMLVLSTCTIYAAEINSNEANITKSEGTSVANESKTSKDDSVTNTLVNMKEDQLKDLESYKAKYGSDTYGLAAYVLHIIQVYSIPIGLVGIAICGIYEYVIGMKRLDIRDKGFNTMIAVITIMIICQILPLIFAIVVKSTD